MPPTTWKSPKPTVSTPPRHTISPTPIARFQIRYSGLNMAQASLAVSWHTRMLLWEESPSKTRSNTSNSSYWYDRIVYNPLFTNMYEQGLVAPYFSLALARTAQNSSTGFGGYLSLGTLPPVPHSDFSIVPVEILDNIPLNYTSGKRVRSYWALTVSGATYGSSTNSTPFQAFVDSGNYISYLPSAIANSVNALFEPPARYDASLGAYVVDCTAKAPSFGLQIGNQTFFHNGADMIYQTGEGICISSVAASENVGIEGLTLNIIGVPFLKNVVAVFDFGWNEMRFAKLK
ncbi:hypothetical protein AWENTII_012110 [Aspergillus wentii]